MTRVLPSRTPLPAAAGAILFSLMMAIALCGSAQASFTVEPIDETGGPDITGWFSSLALNSLDEPRISYEGPGKIVKFAWKSLGAWTTEVVDSGTNADGVWTSLALDATERVHISYQAGPITDRELRYAWKSGGAWTIETADTSRAMSTSIAIDSLGEPVISYADGEGAVMVARRSGGVWTVETVDSATGWGDIHTELRLDDSDGIHLSYGGLGTLNYAQGGGGSWTVETVDTGDATFGRFSSITLDGADTYISYFGDQVQELRLARNSGGTWAIETVDSEPYVGPSGNPGYDTSLEVDSFGSLHVSYSFRYTPGPRYARRVGGNWYYGLVDQDSSSAAQYTSLELDSQQNPHVSYIGGTVWLEWDALYATSVVTGIAPSVSPQAPGAPAPTLAVAPNPVGPAGTRVSFTVPAALGAAEVVVHDVTGRIVRRLASAAAATNGQVVEWNGADDTGRRVAAGTYFLRLSTASGGTATRRVTLVR